MKPKLYKEMDKTQQTLYTSLADVVEKWARNNQFDSKAGVLKVLEVLITLTLAIKALYIIKGDTDNEVPTHDRSAN